jgi:hypothetical protein
MAVDGAALQRLAIAVCSTSVGGTSAYFFVWRHQRKSLVRRLFLIVFVLASVFYFYQEFFRNELPQATPIPEAIWGFYIGGMLVISIHSLATTINSYSS